MVSTLLLPACAVLLPCSLFLFLCCSSTGGSCDVQFVRPHQDRRGLNFRVGSVSQPAVHRQDHGQDQGPVPSRARPEARRPNTVIAAVLALLARVHNQALTASRRMTTYIDWLERSGVISSKGLQGARPTMKRIGTGLGPGGGGGGGGQVQAIVMEAYLQKQSPSGLRSWQQRLVSLHTDLLAYYKKKGDAPIGVYCCLVLLAVCE